MDASTKQYGDAYNAALVVIFRNKKDKLGFDYSKIEELSGVTERTLKRLFTNKSPFTMTQFFAVTGALALDPKDVMLEVEGTVAKMNAGEAAQINARARN